MLMPRMPRERARATFASSTSAPALLKPMRLMMSPAAGRRNWRGCGLPGFGRGVTVPISRKPKPSAARPSIYSPFLSRPAAGAIINRMGFNNAGADVLLANVARARGRGGRGGDIGKNADTPVERAADDYLIGLRKVYSAASYVAVNISSPNTPNLRSLQQHDTLSVLLARLKAEQRTLAGQHGKYVPLAVKIAPDLSAEAVADIAAVLRNEGIDAVIATNTTLAREAVAGLPHGDETGGLSGAPLLLRATEVVRQLHEILGAAVPIIAVGGIFSGEDARAKIAAGAVLVQLYSGLIYRGPALVREVAAALA